MDASAEANSERCTNCGANWTAGEFGADCPQCGGGALTLLCPVCGGTCGRLWQRAMMDSRSENLAHWIGGCGIDVLERPVQPPDREQRDAGQVDEAMAIYGRSDAAGARRLLQEVTARAPATYVRCYETTDGRAVKYWSLEEFVSAVAKKGGVTPPAERVTWSPSAYPRAFYYLAAIAVEAGDFDEAWLRITDCLRLEPDHPLALCEAGLIAGRRGQLQEAVRLCEQALAAPDARPYRPRALRQKAVALIDLGDLDSAEACLGEALRLDSADQRAIDELAYLARLRASGTPQQPELLHPAGVAENQPDSGSSRKRWRWPWQQ